MFRLHSQTTKGPIVPHQCMARVNAVASPRGASIAVASTIIIHHLPNAPTKSMHANHRVTVAAIATTNTHRHLRVTIRDRRRVVRPSRRVRHLALARIANDAAEVQRRHVRMSANGVRAATVRAHTEAPHRPPIIPVPIMASRRHRRRCVDRRPRTKSTSTNWLTPAYLPKWCAIKRYVIKC